VPLGEQAEPLVQGSVLLTCRQPVTGSQLSVVQTLPSLQLAAGPPLQVPPPHVSFVVQAFPSLQGFELFVCTHPLAGSHESVVHGLPSLQFGAGPPLQVPPPQVSPVVQAFPSLQGFVLSVWTQPLPGSHESFVHGLWSSHSAAGPPLQVPPPQVSPVVQAFPSSQGSALLTWAQPLTGSHESVVHRLASLQFGAGPPLQVPPPHVSLVVQAFPSLQGFVLLL
jgi:hypothetical protein